MEDDKKYLFEYDIYKNEILNQCDLKPSEVSKQLDSITLWARSNEHVEDESNEQNIGKWMLFLWEDDIDSVWCKLKKGIMEGRLWKCKVTKDLSNLVYAVRIYTIDYNDMNDVIEVLDYLEANSIKPSGENIKYKTFHQTKISKVSIIKRSPAIYCSDTIRTEGIRKEYISNLKNERFIFEYDIKKNEVILPCEMMPSEVVAKENWFLHAGNNKISDAEFLRYKAGKWMIFLYRTQVDATWAKVKEAIKNGDLWCASISTKPKKGTYVLFVYTYNYEDVQDVVSVLNILEKYDIKKINTVIRYKPNEKSCTAKNGCTSFYTSNSIRGLSIGNRSRHN